MKHLVRRVIEEEEGMYSLLWFSAFAIFILIPFVIFLIFIAQMFYERNILHDYVDQAVVGATTDVNRVNYVSTQGDDLYYWKVDTSGGMTQADGSILLNSSASPVWSFANEIISRDMSASSDIQLDQPITVVVTKKPITQTVNVYSGASLTNTYSTSNTDYVYATIYAKFKVPTTLPTRVMDQLYGGNGTKNDIVVSYTAHATIQEPTMSVNNS